MVERTHKPICDVLMAPTKRKMVVEPRGSFKSSLCSVAYPIHCLNQNPNLRILLDSSIKANAMNWVREIAAKLQMPHMTDLYGTYRTRGDRWQEGGGAITIAQRTKKDIKEASITASGVESGKTSQHFDIIIMDDLNSDDNSQTPEARAKVLKHYQMNIGILEPEGIMVVVGTRYAEDDVIGWVMANEIGVKAVNGTLVELAGS